MLIQGTEIKGLDNDIWLLVFYVASQLKTHIDLLSNQANGYYRIQNARIALLCDCFIQLTLKSILHEQFQIIVCPILIVLRSNTIPLLFFFLVKRTRWFKPPISIVISNLFISTKPAVV